MGNVNDLIDVEISRNTVIIDTQDFNRVILLTDDQVSAPDRIRTYNELSELLDDGYTSSSETYLAALAYFQQTPRPTELVVGRRGATILDISLPASEIVNGQAYEVVIITSSGTQTFTVTAASDAEDNAAQAAQDLLIELVDDINTLADVDVSAVLESTETALTGTLTSATEEVLGTGTVFVSELAVSDDILITDTLESVSISTITDDSQLTLSSEPVSTFSGSAARLQTTISGTATSTGTAVVGTTTAFDTELAADDYIYVGGEVLQVQTVTDATNLVLYIAPAVDFTAATIDLLSAITGTLSLTATVVGTTTAFTTELAVGDYIEVNSERLQVYAIADDTNLTLEEAPAADFTAQTGVLLTDSVAELTLANEPQVEGQQDGFVYSWDSAGLEDIATCLAAVRADDDAWYAIAYTNHTTTEQEDLAAQIETLDKLYFVSSQTASSLDLVNDSNPAAADDIMGLIEEGNYDRTAGVYGATADTDYREMAVLGAKMTAEPGQTNWMWTNLNGQTSDNLTSTNSDNVLDKNGNTYETYAGVDILRAGTVGSGEFIDIIRGADYLRSNIWSEVLRLNVVISNQGSKIPLTDSGVQQIVAVVDAQLKKAQREGFIKPFLLEDDGTGNYNTIDAYEIKVDKVDTLSASDRAKRIAPTIYFIAALSGAVNKVVIRGVLNI